MKKWVPKKFEWTKSRFRLNNCRSSTSVCPLETGSKMNIVTNYSRRPRNSTNSLILHSLCSFTAAQAWLVLQHWLWFTYVCSKRLNNGRFFQMPASSLWTTLPISSQTWRSSRESSIKIKAFRTKIKHVTPKITTAFSCLLKRRARSVQLVQKSQCQKITNHFQWLTLQWGKMTYNRHQELTTSILNTRRNSLFRTSWENILSTKTQDLVQGPAARHD